VSDYNKGFLSLGQLEEIGKLSKLSILDSKRRLSEQVVNAFTFVKLNSTEAQNNAHLPSTGNVIITMGRDGCMFNEEVYISPKPQETIDVSGAGDTFTASFILKYYKTQKIHESIKYANTVAASVVSRRGITVPTKNLTI
jgi:sugar/nucleoside kinase (ribokinase family)